MVRPRFQGAGVPDLFDEVQEDLRAERMQRLMKRYGGLLAGAALLVVLGVAGAQGWRWWQDRQAMQAAGEFLATAQAAAAPGAEDKAIAARFASLAATAPSGYATLARLRAAALLAEGGDRAAALAIWDSLSRDGSVEPLYRDLATLLWGLHALDGGDLAAVESRLAPLATPDGAWRFSAAEVRALAAIRRGETEQARRGLAALAADQAAPEGVRQRATRLLPGLGS
jgi:hypothetical protein